jgi:hypothetical protein
VALAAVFVVDDKPGRPDVSERTARWRRRPGTRFRTARALRVRHNERATPGRVTAALADARYQVAAATAVREGRPAPERTTPCFVDPRHGPSVTTGLYPPSGLTGPVPLCAACAATLAAGSAPAARSLGRTAEAAAASVAAVTTAAVGSVEEATAAPGSVAAGAMAAAASVAVATGAAAASVAAGVTAVVAVEAAVTATDRC